LKKTIADENAMKEQRVKEMNDFGKSRSDMLSKRHNEKCDKLNKEIKALEEQLKGLKDKNKAEENQLREIYKRADNAYRDNLQNYDAEMKQQTRAKEQALEQHD
jgi:ribosomal protein L19E